MDQKHGARGPILSIPLSADSKVVVTEPIEVEQPPPPPADRAPEEVVEYRRFLYQAREPDNVDLTDYDAEGFDQPRPGRDVFRPRVAQRIGDLHFYARFNRGHAVVRTQLKGRAALKQLIDRVLIDTTEPRDIPHFPDEKDLFWNDILLPEFEARYTRYLERLNPDQQSVLDARRSFYEQQV